MFIRKGSRTRCSITYAEHLRRGHLSKRHSPPPAVPSNMYIRTRLLAVVLPPPKTITGKRPTSCSIRPLSSRKWMLVWRIHMADIGFWERRCHRSHLSNVGPSTHLQTFTLCELTLLEETYSGLWYRLLPSKLTFDDFSNIPPGTSLQRRHVLSWPRTFKDLDS